MKVLILKGLPASGKSTYAKELVQSGNWKRVNKDDLRAMLDDSKWSKKNERFVCAVRDLIIVEALSAQKNVVVDDTNLNPKHEEDIRALVESFKPTVEVKFFDTPLEVCIERDLKRHASVGEAVIKKMYKQWLKRQPSHEVLNPSVQYTPPENAPKAIIVDIDGTLAHMVTDRSPYDYHRAHEDEHDEVVHDIVTRYFNDGYTIIICSGREDDCRDVTEKWLAAKEIPYHQIYMRRAGDHRKDSIIKREIFDAKIRDNYDIRFVLDDRNQVVDMWRNELGLKVLQVADGDF